MSCVHQLRPQAHTGHSATRSQRPQVECLLSPKADAQTAVFDSTRGAAFGHKRSLFAQLREAFLQPIKIVFYVLRLRRKRDRWSR
jgi:hypothetical protein